MYCKSLNSELFVLTIETYPLPPYRIVPSLVVYILLWSWVLKMMHIFGNWQLLLMLILYEMYCKAESNFYSVLVTDVVQIHFYIWQGLTATGFKRDQYFVGDINSLYKSGNVTVDVKVDTYSNVSSRVFFSITYYSFYI